VVPEGRLTTPVLPLASIKLDVAVITKLPDVSGVMVIGDVLDAAIVDIR
jgi:hypothetical protein